MLTAHAAGALVTEESPDVIPVPAFLPPDDEGCSLGEGNPVGLGAVEQDDYFPRVLPGSGLPRWPATFRAADLAIGVGGIVIDHRCRTPDTGRVHAGPFMQERLARLRGRHAFRLQGGVLARH